MHRVEPIRDPRKVAAIKKMLRGEKSLRDYALFVVGINTALRISDLLALSVGDVLDEKGDVTEFIEIRERKTRRSARVHLNESARAAILEYFEREPATDPDRALFCSKRSDRPIDRTRAWKLINDWCEAVGLTQSRYGTHTLRKTWGYMARKLHSVPIELIQAKLGHATPAVTKRYLGITDEEITDVERRVVL